MWYNIQMLSKYHSPAETLIHRRDKILDENVLNSIFSIVGFFIALLALWLNYLIPFKGNMTFATLVFVGLISIFALKIVREMDKVKRMNTGISAEKDVGNFLQQSIAPLGYRVLNSLNRNSHDIDHVLVGVSGVYAIETKNLQWLAGKTVTFDGQTILVDGRKLPKTDPVKQAKSAAKEVSIFLHSKGIDSYVIPVVLLPKRVVNSVINENIIVTNLKNFEAYIANAHSKLSKKQVNYFADLIPQMG